MKILRYIVAGCGLAFIGLGASADMADDKQCHAETFYTQMVLGACTGTDGSQDAAKDAMKAFVVAKQNQRTGLTCLTCHENLAPNYDRRPDGLHTFETLGGQVLPSPVTVAAIKRYITPGAVPQAPVHQKILPGTTAGTPAGH